MLVSLASVKSPSPLDGLGGADFAEWKREAQNIAHGVCQSLAGAIREKARKAKP